MKNALDSIDYSKMSIDDIIKFEQSRQEHLFANKHRNLYNIFNIIGFILYCLLGCICCVEAFRNHRKGVGIALFISIPFFLLGLASIWSDCICVSQKCVACIACSSPALFSGYINGYYSFERLEQNLR